MTLAQEYLTLIAAGNVKDAKRIRRVLSKAQKQAADRILRAKQGLRHIVVTS
jgi:hypothetical protein